MTWLVSATCTLEWFAQACTFSTKVRPGKAYLTSVGLPKWEESEVDIAVGTTRGTGPNRESRFTAAPNRRPEGVVTENEGRCDSTRNLSDTRRRAKPVGVSNVCGGRGLTGPSAYFYGVRRTIDGIIENGDVTIMEHSKAFSRITFNGCKTTRGFNSRVKMLLASEANNECECWGESEPEAMPTVALQF